MDKLTKYVHMLCLQRNIDAFDWTNMYVEHVVQHEFLLSAFLIEAQQCSQHSLSSPVVHHLAHATLRLMVRLNMLTELMRMILGHCVFPIMSGWDRHLCPAHFAVTSTDVRLKLSSVGACNNFQVASSIFH